MELARKPCVVRSPAPRLRHDTHDVPRGRTRHGGYQTPRPQPAATAVAHALLRMACYVLASRGYQDPGPDYFDRRYRARVTRRAVQLLEVTSPRLVDHLCRDFEVLMPLVRWLNHALGYQPAKAWR